MLGSDSSGKNMLFMLKKNQTIHLKTLLNQLILTGKISQKKKKLNIKNNMKMKKLYINLKPTILELMLIIKELLNLNKIFKNKSKKS